MRKILVLIIGSAVLLVGVVMIPLPGPALIFIPLGIAILSLEFEWAQRLLEKMKSWIRRRRNKPEDQVP